MDVSSVGRKGGKKGQAKFLGSCHHCGKTGHKAADCWARGPVRQRFRDHDYKRQEQQKLKGQMQGKKGKGSKGKGAKGSGKKGKGVNNVEEEGAGEPEQGGEGWNDEDWAEGEGWDEDEAWNEGDWQESNGLLLGGLEEVKEPKEKSRAKAKAKGSKPPPSVKSESPAATTAASSSTSPPPAAHLSGLASSVQGMSDAEAIAFEAILQAGVAVLQARAKARPIDRSA